MLIVRINVLEPLDPKTAILKDDRNIVYELNVQAFGLNNTMLENNRLQIPIKLGMRPKPIKQENLYECTSIQQNASGDIKNKKIETQIDRKKGIVICESHYLGAIGIKELQNERAMPIQLYFTLIFILLTLLALTIFNGLILWKLEKETKQFVDEIIDQDSNKDEVLLKVRSKCFRPHFYVRSCKYKLYSLWYYACPFTKMIPNFDSMTQRFLLFVIKATEIVFRMSMITPTIFISLPKAIYWTLIVIASYPCSPLQGILFYREPKLETSEFIAILRKKKLY